MVESWCSLWSIGAVMSGLGAMVEFDGAMVTSLGAVLAGASLSVILWCRPVLDRCVLMRVRSGAGHWCTIGGGASLGG
ncbi:unnamed protein product, partial [Sphenostylis stenocarpa]